MRVEVTGVAELSAAIRAAADKLDNAGGPTTAGAEAALRAAPVPRRTGFLAASGVVEHQGDHAAATWTARYARPVHARRPWTPRAAAAAETAATAAYEKLAADAAKQIGH